MADNRQLIQTHYRHCRPPWLHSASVDRQLQAVIDDLESARARLHALWASVSRDAWHTRPGADRWSAGDCIQHLNLASQAILPLVHDGVERAQAVRVAGSCRRDALGWLIAKAIAPASPIRMRSEAAFVPAAEQPAEAAIAEFNCFQDALVACVRAAEHRAIDGVTIVSPFDGRGLRYNLYSALTLVARHQHRHLLQAERAARLRGLTPASAWLTPALAR